MKRRMVPGTPNLLRLVNRNTILFHLEQMKKTSRAELSQLTGLSPPTVSTVVRELLDEGFVCEVGDSVSQGGKPRQLIQLNPNARRIIAIQLNEGKVRIRMTNLSGDLLNESEYVPTEKAANTVVREATEHVKLLISTTNTLLDVEILGIGVAVPGVVDEKGFVSNAPEFGWNNEPVLELFTKYIDLPVIIENDVKLAALGDGWIRKFCSGTMVYVHLDHGIGAGILIDGSLYRGAHFSAGEISNLIVDPLTAKPITASMGKLGKELSTFEEHYGLDALREAMVEDGIVNYKNQPMCDQGFGEATSNILRHLAYGISNLISLLDPHTIVFGGEMTRCIPEFISRFSSELESYSCIVPDMYVTPLGRDASLFGATRAVIDQHKAQVTWTTV
jgi:glucokinase